MIITWLIVVVGLITVFALTAKNKTEISQEADSVLVESKTFWKGLIVGVVIMALGFIQPYSLKRVDAGCVGIVVNLTGDNRGVGKFEYKTGWVVINTWFRRLYEFPTFQQSIEYDKQEMITKGGFPASVHPTFNYSVKPGNVGDMFTNLRRSISDIEQGWLKTAILGALNDVTNRWTVDDIFTHRQQYEAEIAIEANKRLVKWFEISQLRTNIIPPPSLVEGINKKTQAIQEVQVAFNKRDAAVADAQRKMAVARGDSAELVINAAGRAAAIQKEQVSLTPLYIDYLKIQKWNGTLPTFQGSGVPLINLNN